MPVRIPEGLPAMGELAAENIFAMAKGRAIHQDIRPLRIAVLNLGYAQVMAPVDGVVVARTAELGALAGSSDPLFTLIDKGDYGYCNGCGIEIGIKRLEARPTATLCIDCKTLEEVREKQIAK